ncbi:MAG: hypothetical protein JWQ18_751 [Conexibacter sp.]|nr:hypothetical protein [Conexibacter sp.]
MATDASAALGAPEIAGTLVAAKGLTKKMTAKVAGGQLGGLVGTLAANAVTAKRDQVPDLPSFGSIGYLAASEQDLAVVKTRTGFTPKPTDKALAVVPRSEVKSITFDPGYVSHLKIEFEDGKLWEFDVARVYRKNAKSFVERLGGTID